MKVPFLSALVLIATLSLKGQTSFERTFEGIKEIEFRISSGDALFEKSDSESVNISIPDGIEVDFDAGSGNLEMTGLNVETKGNTGSGSYELQDVSGDFRLNTGSGDIELENAKGSYDLNTGSGDIDLRNSEVQIDANTGSGEVLAKSIDLYLRVS